MDKQTLEGATILFDEYLCNFFENRKFRKPRDFEIYLYIKLNSTVVDPGPENCMKMKVFGLREVPGVPLDPPL